MNTITSDQRIESIVSITTPDNLSKQLPLKQALAQQVLNHREAVANIIQGKNKRQLVVVGPCSIHEPASALEYADKLIELRNHYIDTLEIVMRVYFEKPRTIVGWKGLINDPDLDGTCQIDKGLYKARELLLAVVEKGLPVGCEFLDAATGQYYADTVSWGAIGARTTESQVHRELASGLSCPIGFKNGTNGNVDIAIDAIQSAKHPHAFLSPDQNGQLSLYKTTGNSDAHVILRGGKAPNYDAESVALVIEKQQNANLTRRVLVDCSHANSGKDYTQQGNVLNNIGSRLGKEIDSIAGIMLESHLVEGKQALSDASTLTYGQSITDGCIGWKETESLLDSFASSTATALQQV